MEQRGEKEGQYEQDDVENKRGMEWTDGTEGANSHGSSLCLRQQSFLSTDENTSRQRDLFTC